MHKWVAHELMARERVPLVEVHDNKWVDLVHELVHEMVVHELVPLLEEHNEMVHEMVGARGRVPLAEARDNK